MAEYQNLFTSVQPVGPLHDGIELPRGDDKRTGTPFLVHLLGRIGNAQIGPVYLGSLGVASWSLASPLSTSLASTCWPLLTGIRFS
jgi:photosynthetic reaction center M subunit